MRDCRREEFVEMVLQFQLPVFEHLCEVSQHYQLHLFALEMKVDLFELNNFILLLALIRCWI